MAGTWDMTDEQFAIKAARYRRAWLLVALGNALLAGLQVALFLTSDADGVHVGLGFMFAALAAVAGLVRRRGLPDTRQ